MRFLVDAQLPRRLADFLATAGHDVVHTSRLPLGNRTPDGELLRIARREERVVVTKDRDFEISHLVRGEPTKLVLVTAGNMVNDDMIGLVRRTLPTIVEALVESNYVELTATSVIVRRGSGTA